MKPWRLQTDRDGRDRSGEDRARRRSRPGVERLEGRNLLSTVQVQAVPTTNPQRNVHQPAAYKPPTQAVVQFPPYNIDPELISSTDPSGTGHVLSGNVQVGGTAFPYSTIWLAVGTRPGYFTNIAQANGLGQYAFNIQVGRGTTTLLLFAENSVQDYSNVNTVTVSRGNAIEAWDAVALRAIRDLNLPSSLAARDLAILHSAQYDAVAALADPSSAYQVRVTATKGASAEAAADSAADTVLAALFPTEGTLIQAANTSAMGGLVKSPSVSAGVVLGRQVADQTLANRSNDGANLVVGLAPSNVDGLWRPTPPTYSAATTLQFARVTPFEIDAPSAFRPAAPPQVGSTAYDQALAEVSTIGRIGSTTRTADQTAAALFWNDGTGLNNDPAHWNAIAEQVSLARGDSLLIDARLFAQLDFAMADAAIASTDSQVAYDEWRPISAVQKVDPTFSPFLATPASPSYVSDSAAYGSAAARVLSSTFGSKFSFTDATQSASGSTRTFASFDAAATDQASSRVWGGVNFSTDTQAGSVLGDQVGQAVLAKFPKAK